MKHPHLSRRSLGWLAAFVVIALLGAVAYVSRHQPETTHAYALTPKQQVPAKAAPLSRFIAAAGGATPDSNPISLEQNLALAHAVLPGPGVLLFGSGPRGTTVQVLDDTLPHDELMHALGELFAPRAGRDSRYRSTALPAAAATLTAVRAELSIALSRPGTALLLYLSGHGDRAEDPRDNHVQLWGGEGLSAVDIADMHDHARSRRDLRVVITSCYSGGFAELAFAGADSARGASKKTRCGLFATTADLESSGCDPNPDRAAQEGYSLHMLNALRGMDRDGQTPIDADYDDDGKVTLLEAHTRARIAGRSIDVPTTTSERFLREHTRDLEGLEIATAELPADNTFALPEEQAVIAALGAELSLSDAAAAETALHAIEDEIDAHDQRLADAQDENDRAFNALSMQLLEQWPVIDDPFHPLFAETITRDRDAILNALTRDEAAQRYLQSQAELRARDAELEVVELRYALVARLHRAHENVDLSARLKRQAGKVWSQYQSLLRCERGLP